MDPETAASLGWLTNLAVMKVGLMVERIPTDPETAASLDWLTSLDVMKVGLMVEHYQLVGYLAG